MKSTGFAAAVVAVLTCAGALVLWAESALRHQPPQTTRPRDGAAEEILRAKEAESFKRRGEHP